MFSDTIARQCQTTMEDSTVKGSLVGSIVWCRQYEWSLVIQYIINKLRY